MRVAYVANCDLPNPFAHAVQIMKNAQAWQRNTDAFQFVSNLTIRHWARVDQQSINAYYGITDAFDMKLYPYLGFTGKSWSPIHDMFFRQAAKYLADWRAELVFTRTFALPRHTLGLGIPTLAETHGPPDDSREKNELYERLGEDKFLGLVTISEPLRQRYVAHGLPENKILVAADGVDLVNFANPLSRQKARQLLGVPGEGPYAVYVGHLYDDRGIGEILATAARLPHVSFVIVGGHLVHVRQWREKLARMKLENLSFVGFVNNSEVPKYLWMADILLMPYSQSCPTAEWMSPLKMFEYMAAGRAIIATGLDAIRNVLTHGQDAFLVKPDSADSLTEGVVKLLDDTDLRESLAVASLKAVQAHTWDARVQKILRFARAAG